MKLGSPHRPASLAVAWPQDQRKSPDSNRDISGLIDGQAYMSEAKSSSKTPPCVMDGGQDMVEVIAPKWKGKLITSYRETDIRWAH